MATKDLVPIGQVGGDGTLFANPALLGGGMQQQPAQQPMIMMGNGGGGGGSNTGSFIKAAGAGFLTLAGLIQRANLNRLQDEADKKEVIADAAQVAADAANTALAQMAVPTDAARQAVFNAMNVALKAQRDLNDAASRVSKENSRSALYTTVGGVADLAEAFLPDEAVQGGGQQMFYQAQQPMPMQMQMQQPQGQQVLLIPQGGGGFQGASPALTGAIAGGTTALLVNVVSDWGRAPR